MEQYAHVENAAIYFFDEEINSKFEAEELPVGFGRGKSFLSFLMKQPVEIQTRIRKMQRVSDGTTRILPAVEPAY